MKRFSKKKSKIFQLLRPTGSGCGWGRDRSSFAIGRLSDMHSLTHVAILSNLLLLPPHPV